MLSQVELLSLLKTAKADGCVRFPGDKNYKGDSVFERLKAAMPDEDISKAQTKRLLAGLAKIKGFEGLSKYNGGVERVGGGQGRSKSVDLFGAIFGNVETTTPIENTNTATPTETVVETVVDPTMAEETVTETVVDPNDIW